jgi:hypothetical protein
MVVSLFLTRVTLAAPSEPAKVVNHTTKECGTMYTGDECETCVPTKGWEILNGECPQGYTELDIWIPYYSCTFDEKPLCCTKGHYGAQDICPNLVVNPIAKQCTLNNENKVFIASYPIGWIPSPVFLCSENYEWTDSVNYSNNQWNYISIAIILVVIVIAVAAFILLFRRKIKHDYKPPNKA